MVVCTSKDGPKQSLLTNGNVSIDCDNPTQFGGEGYVFNPFELIEAGYAACINATTRGICAEKGVEYSKVVVAVELDNSNSDTATLRSKVNIEGVSPDIAAEIIKEEHERRCPVERMLRKRIVFESLAVQGIKMEQIPERKD